MTFDDIEASTWTQSEGVALAKAVEAVAPEHGAHVALTGGLLYKDGERKDADLLFYRIRQTDHINLSGLFTALKGVGLTVFADYGFVKKARYADGRTVDLLFPEQCRSEPDALADPRGY